MSEAEPSDNGEVPDGAAVFPEIPEELGVDPLLLVALHATVFLAGSDASIVQPDASDEAVEQIAAYMQRLHGERLRRVREDMHCLATFARQEKWPKGLIQSLRGFLTDLGVDTDTDTETEDGE